MITMSFNSKLSFVKTHKAQWNKKTEIGADNKLFKIIGIGPVAFKVLWFGPTPGVKKGTWNQCWWNYDDLDETAIKVINKMYKKLSGGQTTL